jgi:hypothetical protein
MKSRFAVVLVLLASLAGCSQDALLQKFASAEDQATAKKYIDHLRAEQFAEIEAVADPGIQGPQLRSTLEQMAQLLPDSEPTAAKLIGAQTLQGAGGITKNLSFEYQFGERWLLLNVATREKDGRFTIIGFNVYPQAQSLQEQHRFTLAGKTPAHYLIFALAILFPLLTLYALILCIRTKMAARKWLWIMLILFGAGKLAINWTTGEWQFMPLAIQAFSASVFSPGYGPWHLAVSLPLGAVVFLFWRRAQLVQRGE